MTEADQLLQSGDLDGARRVLIEAARRSPGDVPTRLFLFQLMAVAGEWAKAKAQLTTLAQLSPEAAMLSVVYGQALDAEVEREAVFTGTAVAHIHGESKWVGEVAQALRLEAMGETDAAAERREAAFSAASDTPGMVDGAAVEWIADADTRFGPTMEAIIGGRYGLLPFDAVSKLTSEGPKDLRDVVWYPVELTLKAGARIAALLPARYPGIAANAAERLGRATDWDDAGHGSGQRLWIGSDGEDRPMLSVRTLTLS